MYQTNDAYLPLAHLMRYHHVARAVFDGGSGGFDPPQEVADPPESSAEPLGGRL